MVMETILPVGDNTPVRLATAAIRQSGRTAPKFPREPGLSRHAMGPDQGTRKG